MREFSSLYKMKYILLFLSTIFFQSCTNSVNNIKKPANKEPSWINNPQTNSKLAAVGCSQIHIRGIHAQKKLAVSRAIEQIALQKNAHVQVISYRKKIRSNGSIKSSIISETSSVQETQTNIKTIVKEFHTNKDKEICAWVEEK